MANVAGVLKAEIFRISRKEVKAAIKGILKSNATLRRSVVDLKRKVTRLEKDNKHLRTTRPKQLTPTPAIPAKESKRARVTSKGVLTLRRKLGLTQAAFAKLVGATPHAVYLWETKEGNLNLRSKTKTALLALRGIGVREAKKRLAEVQGELKAAVGRSVNRKRN